MQCICCHRDAESAGATQRRRNYDNGTKSAGSRRAGCRLWSAARDDGSHEAELPELTGSRGAPINQFLHVRAFPPASFKQVVRVNVDTLYSSAFLDLSEEPLVLSVPDTHGRYYLLPLFDAWTNVFATPGTRTTGNSANSFLIAGPDWSGTAPAGMQVLRSPTNMAWLLGRTQTNGPEDYPAVHAVQDGYKLVPLSKFGASYVPAKVAVDPELRCEDAARRQAQTHECCTVFRHAGSSSKSKSATGSRCAGHRKTGFYRYRAGSAFRSLAS